MKSRSACSERSNTIYQNILTYTRKNGKECTRECEKECKSLFRERNKQNNQILAETASM